MTSEFQFESTAERAVGTEIGFVIRPSASQSRPADRLFLERTRHGYGIRTVAPDTKGGLSLFRWACRLHGALGRALRELKETQERLEEAREAAQGASTAVVSAPLRDPGALPGSS